MIINWNNSESPVFITTTQAKEVLEVLEKHGLFDQHEWMTVGYGYNPEGEDVNWHSADTDVEVPEFWEETIFDLHYWGKEISYPFDWAHKVNQKQGIKRYLDEVKTVEAIKKGIDDFGGDLLYDLDYRITEGFFILQELSVGSGTERGSNDNWESYVGGDWKITVDLTKIAPLEE